MKSNPLQSVRRLLTILLGGLAMISALRWCAPSLSAPHRDPHGREVAVPNLAGLSDSDAADAARELGLNLSVENRFYSPTVQPEPHPFAVSGSRIARPARLAGPHYRVARPPKACLYQTSLGRQIAQRPSFCAGASWMWVRLLTCPRPRPQASCWRNLPRLTPKD